MNWLIRISHLYHEPLKGPLIVSGYGHTEYEIYFCKKCGKIVWKMTKDIDKIYGIEGKLFK